MFNACQRGPLGVFCLEPQHTLESPLFATEILVLAMPSAPTTGRPTPVYAACGDTIGEARLRTTERTAEGGEECSVHEKQRDTERQRAREIERERPAPH